MIASSVPPEIPLHRLRPGESACIARIVGRPDDVRRLAEFGLHAGSKIEMFRPGSPCILRMAGSKVCVRTENRFEVFVITCKSIRLLRRSTSP